MSTLHSPDFAPKLLKPSDFQSLMLLEQSSFSLEDRWSEESMKEEIEANGDGFRIIKPKDRVVAYVQYQVGYDRLPEDAGFENDGQIGSLAVDEEFRRKGLGTLLLRTAIDELRQKQVNRILFTTRASNTSMYRLGIQHGFRVTGVKNGYYRNGDGSMENGLVLELK